MPIRAGSSLLSALRLGGSPISKVYAGTSLVFDAAPAFDPLTLAPSMWIDASDASTISLVDGRVAQASDKSGNGRHARQSTAANQPSYTASHAVANNKPALFNATSTGRLETETSVVEEEVYIVAAYGTGVEANFNAANAGGIGDGYSALFSGTGTNGMPRIMGNLGSASFIQSNHFASGAYRNRETVMRGTGNSGQPTILPLPLSVLRFQKQAAATADSRRQLMNQTNANRPWGGPWCERLSFPAALAEADRSALVEHLIAKWGIVP